MASRSVQPDEDAEDPRAFAREMIDAAAAASRKTADALAVARGNAARLGLSVEFVETDDATVGLDESARLEDRLHGRSRSGCGGGGGGVF